MIDRVGQQLGNYRLFRLIRRGFWASVYLGEHLHLGMQAALKVLHTNVTSEDREKLCTEAHLLAHLEHPLLLRILDFDVEDGIPFLVMTLRSPLNYPSTLCCYAKSTSFTLY